jgi:hypothetical protein
MGKKKFKTVKGIWVNVNLFITDSGKHLRVYPWGWIYKQYKDKFPFEAFINLRGDEIISVEAL